MRFRLTFVLQSLKNSNLSRKIDSEIIKIPSDKVLSPGIIEQDEVKKSNVVEEDPNLFTDIENKNDFELIKYRSFIMLMIELGLESSDIYTNIDKNSVFDDYLEGPQESQYHKFVTKFKRKYRGFYLRECRYLQGKMEF